jgi:hypothetical protein
MAQVDFNSVTGTSAQTLKDQHFKDGINLSDEASTTGLHAVCVHDRANIIRLETVEVNNVSKVPEPCEISTFCSEFLPSAHTGRDTIGSVSCFLGNLTQRLIPGISRTTQE